MKNINCITTGKFLSFLLEQTGQQKIMKSYVREGGKTYLGERKSIELLQASGKTVVELFNGCGISIKETDRDKEIFSCIGNMSVGKKNDALILIRNVTDDPWWIEFLDSSDIRKGTRLREYVYRNYAKSTSRRKMSKGNSTFISENFDRFSGWDRIETDDIPTIAAETGYPISFFFNLPIREVHFYSQDVLTDRLYSEFKMLRRHVAEVAYTYIRVAGGRG